MAEKPKSKPTRVLAAKPDRGSGAGRFTQRSAKSVAASASTQPPRPAPKDLQPAQALPIESDVDTRQFAKDLLVSDKIIMDYLAR